MRAIIDGRRYDTKTAEEVAEYHSPHFAGDFRSFSETLYRTPRGSWFLVGAGNAASPYGQAVVDGQGPGKRIIPFSEDDVCQWLEAREEFEALEAYFADSIEDA